MAIWEQIGGEKEPLFLMDGTAYMFRSFFTGRNIQRSDGFPTNVLVGVSRLLLKILREEKPAYFLFVRDGHEPTFRHTIYPEYKANREATPEDLVKQIEPVSRMVHALGICEEETHGYEADDCLATLASKYAKDRPCIILSGDKDLKQCLGPNVYLWNPGSKDEGLYSAADFTREMGVEPSSWPDMQALIGDSADNIPGVPKIGIKTAQTIFSYVSSLEELRDHPEKIPPKLQSKIRPYIEESFRWRELTRLSTVYSPNISLESMKVHPLRAEECALLADEFELVALRRELEFVRVTQKDAQKSEGTLPLKEKSGKKVQEVSLLGETKPVSRECCAVRSIEELAESEGKIFAIIGTSPLHLAFIDEEALHRDDFSSLSKEYVWQGESSLIIDHLSKARSLLVSDVKAFFRMNSVYADFFDRMLNEKVIDLGLALYLLHPEETDFSWAHIENYWAVPFQNGQRGEAQLALCLWPSVEKQLISAGLMDLYRTMELPLTKVLADMERRGIAIDEVGFRQFLSEVQSELERITAQIYALAGSHFNIRSSQQLGHVLYTVLKLKGAGRTKGGQASTSQQTLEKLAGTHPVIDAVLHFRKLEKIRSTYLEPLPRLMDAKKRIHTNFNQKGTATGRLSSSDPNLQNIPARGELGLRMRRCFVAGEGCCLISSDYSQIELRVLAHMSQDPALLEAFRAGLDIHAHTAHLIYDIPLEMVTKEQRSNAKTINFGLIYGMGAQKLARELSLSLQEAKDFINNYFSRLTVLKTFYESVVNEAKEKGYVVTLGGRRRSLPDLLSLNANLSAQASRQAVNTVIQGSAADIIKLAMLDVARDDLLESLNARLVLQIHDELVLEVPKENCQEAAMRVCTLMENVVPKGGALSVPLKADFGYGASWGEAH